MTLAENEIRRQYRQQKSALTRAVNSGDPGKVKATCIRALAEWSTWPHGWPDDWTRWNIALQDATGGAVHGMHLDELQAELRAKVRQAEQVLGDAARDPLKSHLADVVFDAVSNIGAVSLGDTISWMKAHRHDNGDIELSVCRRVGDAPVKYYMVKITEKRI
jgi:hypothetical protein